MKVREKQDTEFMILLNTRLMTSPRNKIINSHLKKGIKNLLKPQLYINMTQPQNNDAKIKKPSHYKAN